MTELILITGGARSGKSRFALQLDKQEYENNIFIATSLPVDEEMETRIKNHKKERGGKYKTIEEPYLIYRVFDKLDSSGNFFIILDCITVWLGNLFYKYNSSLERIGKEISKFISALEGFKSRGNGRIVIITNELGSGIVPENKTARIFRDTEGSLNQALAEFADNVYLCVCGIPVKIKS
jgi:adenosylcobinamide kinase/adenosylcobinamide-phosphate guanylyltransferase